MYKISRKHIVEEIEFEDNGKVLHLDVDINVDSILRAYTNAQLQIAAASKQAQEAADNKDMSAAEEAMGTAVINLFRIIFGDAQAEQILDFYDNHALEMLGDVMPFINTVITPKIAEARERIAESYKQVRQGKRVK